jgi:prepilin-type N-terminal cleavage/methylation domain-containing protein
MFKRLRQINQGFTLIEIMVVVSIVAILAAVIGVNALQSGQQSRDAKRQADIRTLQSAVELYKNKYGRYPEQCPQLNPGISEGWSGQIGTNFACADSTNRYVFGASGREFSEFMATLPVDKKLNGTNSGYVYRTNSNGTVYKIKALRTVEADTITYTHPLKPCDIRVASDPATGSLSSGSTDVEVIGWCGRVFFSGNTLPDQCRSINAQWSDSYGVWGGFEALVGGANPYAHRRNTTDVICR